MEESEIAHIKTNLPKLIENTVCNTHLISILIAAGVIHSNESQMLTQNGTDFDRAFKLYELLMKRDKAYSILKQALKDTNQSGALKLLTNRIDQTDTIQKENLVTENNDKCYKIPDIRFLANSVASIPTVSHNYLLKSEILSGNASHKYYSTPGNISLGNLTNDHIEPKNLELFCSIDESRITNEEQPLCSDVLNSKPSNGQTFKYNKNDLEGFSTLIAQCGPYLDIENKLDDIAMRLGLPKNEIEYLHGERLKTPSLTMSLYKIMESWVAKNGSEVNLVDVLISTFHKLSFTSIAKCLQQKFKPPVD